MTASVKPDELEGPLSLLRHTWVTVWQHRVAIYGYAAWLLLPSVIALFAQRLPSPTGNFFILTSDVLAILLGLWVTSAIMLYVTASAIKERHEDVNYQVLSNRAWERVLPLFVVQVVTVCLIVFGTILFIIPGLIAWVVTTFAVQEVVLVKSHLGLALKNSYKLVQGRFLAILGRLLAAYGVFIAISLSLFGSYLALGLHGSVAGVIPTLMAWPFWLEIGLSLILLPLTPFAIVFNLHLYFAAQKSYSARHV